MNTGNRTDARKKKLIGNKFQSKIILSNSEHGKRLTSTMSTKIAAAKRVNRTARISFCRIESSKNEELSRMQLMISIPIAAIFFLLFQLKIVSAVAANTSNKNEILEFKKSVPSCTRLRTLGVEKSKAFTDAALLS